MFVKLVGCTRTTIKQPANDFVPIHQILNLYTEIMRRYYPGRMPELRFRTNLTLLHEFRRFFVVAIFRIVVAMSDKVFEVCYW